MCFVQHRPTPVTCLGSGGGGGGGGLGPGEAEADAELDQQEPGGAGQDKQLTVVILNILWYSLFSMSPDK